MNEHLLLVMLINVGKLQWLSCFTLFNWQYFDDNSFGREILNIVTLCLYKDAGCQWMDAVKNVEVSTKITLILDKLINKMSSKSWLKDCLKCFFFIGLSNNSDWNMNLIYLISPFKTIEMNVLEIWRCKILNLQQY